MPIHENQKIITMMDYFQIFRLKVILPPSPPPFIYKYHWQFKILFFQQMTVWIFMHILPHITRVYIYKLIDCTRYCGPLRIHYIILVILVPLFHYSSCNYTKLRTWVLPIKKWTWSMEAVFEHNILLFQNRD